MKKELQTAKKRSLKWYVYKILWLTLIVNLCIFTINSVYSTGFHIKYHDETESIFGIFVSIEGSDEFMEEYAESNCSTKVLANNGFGYLLIASNVAEVIQGVVADNSVQPIGVAELDLLLAVQPKNIMNTVYVDFMSKIKDLDIDTEIDKYEAILDEIISKDIESLLNKVELHLFLSSAGIRAVTGVFAVLLAVNLFIAHKIKKVRESEQLKETTHST